METKEKNHQKQKGFKLQTFRIIQKKESIIISLVKKSIKVKKSKDYQISRNRKLTECRNYDKNPITSRKKLMSLRQ